MLVYHGSSHNFQTLRIRKDLTRESSRYNEGFGIYFSLNRDVAQSYGKYIYTLDVNDAYLKDMRVAQVCRSYVMQLRKELRESCGVAMERYLDPLSVARAVCCGQIAVIGMAREVQLLLDSSERFYVDWRKNTVKTMTWLSRWHGVPKAYLFPYHIKDCGIIRDVSPDVVTIVSKEKMYVG